MSRTDNKQSLSLGWPPIMDTDRAGAYANVKPSTLRQASKRKQIYPAGRRGRLLMWHREDIDRWMLGLAPTNAPKSADDSAPIRAKADGNALDRIRRAAEGGE